MNPVLILTHNNLELTKRCIASVQRQDIPAEIAVVDNKSSDGTQSWLMANLPNSRITFFFYNAGVSQGWNEGLRALFEIDQARHVLVLNNDTILPPWFYRELLAYKVSFVTGLAQDNLDEIATPKPPVALHPHPDFSAFLIRREAWETVGPFDERMKLYASDCDWHCRAHRKGLQLWKANTSYYHERSSTLRLASDQERQEILETANRDRAFFRSLYGCIPGEPQYSQLFE
jgi:GT2 family glycosyltransferase